MESTIRKIVTLCRKDFVDLFKNPSMVVCLVMPIAFAVLFRYGMGNFTRASIGETAGGFTGEAAFIVDSFTLSTMLCMTIGMVVSMSVVYGIAEEKEKHTLRTLMLANVSAAQVLISRSVVTLLASIVVSVVCFFVVEVVTISWLVPYIGLCVLGALPIIMISLIFGLAARDQMTAGLYSVPVILIALAPMFGIYQENIQEVTQYLPTGGIDSLVQLMVRNQLFTSEAVIPLVVTLAWTVAGIVLFALLYKRLTRDN